MRKHTFISETTVMKIMARGICGLLAVSRTVPIIRTLHRPVFKKIAKPSHTQTVQCYAKSTRWFKYDRDYLCVNKSQFVPVIFEPPCIWNTKYDFHETGTGFYSTINLFISLRHEFYVE